MVTKVVATETKALLKEALAKGKRVKILLKASKLMVSGIHCTGTTNSAPFSFKEVMIIHKKGINIKMATNDARK